MRSIPLTVWLSGPRHWPHKVSSLQVEDYRTSHPPKCYEPTSYKNLLDLLVPFLQRTPNNTSGLSVMWLSGLLGHTPFWVIFSSSSLHGPCFSHSCLPGRAHSNEIFLHKILPDSLVWGAGTESKSQPGRNIMIQGTGGWIHKDHFGYSMGNSLSLAELMLCIRYSIDFCCLIAHMHVLNNGFYFPSSPGYNDPPINVYGKGSNSIYRFLFHITDFFSFHKLSSLL